jgi:alpha-1,3-rhamnosyl/mannosyltransferase
VGGLLREGVAAETLRYLGPVADVDLPALYRGASLFVFPSHYEGFGLPVLEAMASGTPVLCSTTEALQELSGGTARHVEPEDGPGWTQALRDLLEDSTQRASLAARGRLRASAFTPERTATAILGILDEAATWPR